MTAFKVGLVAALVLLTGCVKTVGKKITSDFSKNLSCGLSVSFSSMSSGITLEILDADLDRFVAMIRTKKINNEKQFWAATSTGDAELISTWLNDGYQKTFKDSHIRDRDNKFYEQLFVKSLISIAAEKKKFQYYNLVQVVATPKKDGAKSSDVYESFKITLIVPDRKSVEPEKTAANPADQNKDSNGKTISFCP